MQVAAGGRVSHQGAVSRSPAGLSAALTLERGGHSERREQLRETLQGEEGWQVQALCTRERMEKEEGRRV